MLCALAVGIAAIRPPLTGKGFMGWNMYATLATGNHVDLDTRSGPLVLHACLLACSPRAPSPGDQHHHQKNQHVLHTARPSRISMTNLDPT